MSSISTASNRAPHTLRVRVSEGKLSVSWSAPRTSDGLSHYIVMYGPIISTARKNKSVAISSFATDLTDILPQTLYGVSVAAVYGDGTSFTLPEDVVLTYAGTYVHALKCTHTHTHSRTHTYTHTRGCTHKPTSTIFIYL